MHGLSSIAGLIDQNEEMICEVLLKENPSSEADQKALKLTPKMKEEMIEFITQSVAKDHDTQSK